MQGVCAVGGGSGRGVCVCVQGVFVRVGTRREREAEAAACAPTPSVRLETAPGAHRSTRAGARQSITNLGDCVEDPWIVRINGQQ